MSFNADRKAEHEEKAAAALRRKDYESAFFHTVKAAEFTFNLAEMSEGKLAESFLEDALELTEIARQLKEKAAQQRRENERQKLADENGDEKDNADASPWLLKKKPDIRLDDVAGLDDVKAALMEDVILPLKHPEVFDRFGVRGGGGVLMYGPPGTGKTFIAKAIAGELDAAFFSVDAAQIKDKYVGETEKNMKRLFEQARQHERAVIFFDEIDAILHKRGAQKVNAVTEFLIMADGLTNNDDKGLLLLLGATNKPWDIDPAALRPGRFGRQIYVGLPDAKAREGILEYCFRDTPLEEGFSFADLARKMDGYSGADIAEVCRRAKKKAIRRQIETGRDEVVTMADVDAILAKFTPSVSREDLAVFEKWRGEREAPG